MAVIYKNPVSFKCKSFAERYKDHEASDLLEEAALLIDELETELVERVGVPDDGVSRIAAERKRQVSVEGWSNDHDAEHVGGDLARAAACYALPKGWRVPSTLLKGANPPPREWPWDTDWWKPTPDNRIRELEKAGALIAAEIDRLLTKVSP